MWEHTYGLSFGALAVAAGLSLPQICVLSSLISTGASQFGMVGVIAAGGNPLAGAATAALLGTRNALYGFHLSSLLRLTGWRRAGAAQFVIDESAAMAVGRDSDRAVRLGFWAAGLGCRTDRGARLLPVEARGSLGSRAVSAEPPGAADRGAATFLVVVALAAAATAGLRLLV